MAKLTKQVEEATYFLELTVEEVTALAKILGERSAEDDEELGLDPEVSYPIYIVLIDPPSPVDADGEELA